MDLQPLPSTPPRSRSLYAALVLVVIGLGLASRRFSWLLPTLLQKNAGDILWATMVFFGGGLLFPRVSTLRLAAFAMLFSVGIEFAKFYHAPWFDPLRATTLGRLIFGYQFSWSNLLCYLLGIGLGVVGELWRSSALSHPRR